ncbi:uncharacterized protein LOC142643493 [Castanea sativa]|uniref:uncharacterized protein LOC142643493 n=1 Tax=Castanea sativa TaxID=21020 RepID=UPI003F653D28
MVSDLDLVNRLREILRSSDLDTATAGGIRRQLEKDFGVDLSDRKTFVRDQIDIFLETLPPKQEQEEEEEEEEEEEDAEEVGGESENVKEENDVVEEEEEEEEEESEAKGRKKGGSNKVDKEVKKRGGGGFNKLCSLSPKLQEFVGVPELARTQVVKKVWAYIRENDLQDPKNRRNIRCDESLHTLFRVKTINMFQMNKALSKHIWPLENGDVKQKVIAEESAGSVSEDVSNAEEQEEDDEEEKEEEKEEEEEEEREEKIKEEEEEEEEGLEEERNGRGSKKRERSAKKVKDTKKRGGGFTKLCSLSPQLQTFTGATNLARTEVVKKLWAYIRENNLQDPKNRQNILCDESLRAIFRVDCINMFQMNKALTKHIWPLNVEDGVPDDSLQKEKQCKQEDEEEEDSDDPNRRGKRQKKGSSGLLACLPLSDALVKFLGTGENSLSRAGAVKRMWEYIKQNDLQDPSDKRRILCDDKLKELFGVDSFNGFTVSKLLTTHFIKTEQ